MSAGLNLVLLFYAFQVPNASGIRQRVGWILLFFLLALGVGEFIDQTPAACRDLYAQQVDQLRLYQRAKEVAKDDTRVDYFFSDSPEYALYYGNGYSGMAFGPLLTKMYPKAFFFNIFNAQFGTFTEFLEPNTVLPEYDHLYFLGSPSLFPKVDGLDPRTFETIDHAGDYYLQKWTRK